MMMFFILIWSLSSLAFFTLASALPKHQKQIFNRELSPLHTLFAKLIGWGLLIISLLICLFTDQLSNMLSYWIAVLTFSALFVMFCLSYLQSRIQWISYLCAGFSVLSTIIYLS